jgi:nitroreductase
MDLFDAIARRHCYRGAYLPQPVSREDLRKIVQAGLDAPSGKNGQTTTFVVVDDEAILSKIRPSTTAIKPCSRRARILPA